MTESGPEPGGSRFFEAVAEGTPVDWESTRAALGEDRSRSLQLIDSVFRDYERAADQVRACLTAPLLAPDSRWGPLRVLQPIGSGTFGQVFRAFDPSLQRDVALKVFRARPRSGTGVPRFLEEGRRLARVHHRGVLTVHGVAVHGGRAGIWTELVRGQTLEEILGVSGPFGGGEAARIGIDLCAALSAVHAAGLIHRDVKTQNVMRDDEGRVVLTDFGAMDERFDEARAESSAYGSLLSVAPELLRGERATPASDVYSLGVLLYRVLTRRYPVVADSTQGILSALESQAPQIDEIRPDLPPDLARVVHRATLVDPEKRFPGPNAMAQALRSTIEPTATLLPPPKESYRPPRSRDSMPAAMGIAIAISVLVTIGVLAVLVPWLGRQFGRSQDRETPAATAPAPPRVPAAALAGLEEDPRLVRMSRLGSESLIDGATIRAGDQLIVELRTGSKPVTCYVLDEDGAGVDYLLFPLPGYRLENPLPPGARHRLPDGSGRDSRTWLVSSENGEENVAVVTSVAPIPWLEKSLRDWPRASAEGSTEVATGPSPNPPGVVTRGIGHTAPPPQTGKLKTLLDRLRDSDEVRSGQAGIWTVRLRAGR